MAWTIEFARSVPKELKKLGPQAAQRILDYLKDRVAPLEDPRSVGEPLHGPELGRFWKYRVGHYRLICSIQDEEIVILVVRVGHRRDVYR